jgi:hypothetical protein
MLSMVAFSADLDICTTRFPYYCLNDMPRYATCASACAFQLPLHPAPSGNANPHGKDKFYLRVTKSTRPVALFIRPVEYELQITKDILNIFCNASGLQTNLQKSSIIHICCETTTQDLIIPAGSEAPSLPESMPVEASWK